MNKKVNGAMAVRRLWQLRKAQMAGVAAVLAPALGYLLYRLTGDLGAMYVTTATIGGVAGFLVHAQGQADAGKEAVQVQAAVDAALKRVQLVLPLVLAIGLGSAAIGCSGRAREAIAADAIAYVVDAAGVSVRSRWRSEYDSAAAKAFADGKSRAAAIVELDRVEARFSRTASALDAVAAVQTRFVALLEHGIPPPLSALLAAYCDVRHAIQREYELPGVLPGGVSCP